jgi:hypothetical protein
VSDPGNAGLHHGFNGTEEQVDAFKDTDNRMLKARAKVMLASDNCKYRPLESRDGNHAMEVKSILNVSAIEISDVIEFFFAAIGTDKAVISKQKQRFSFFIGATVAPLIQLEHSRWNFLNVKTNGPGIFRLGNTRL